MILIDTSVWIEWSNRASGREAQEVDRLLAQDDVAITEIVIGEFLQGLRTEQKFSEYSERLDGLHYFPAVRSTWAAAARRSFQLWRRGLATPLADLVIAQVAIENGLSLYAIDPHFDRVDGVKLHAVL